MIVTEDQGALRIIRLARADKANALTAEMLAAIATAAETAAASGIQVLVLTGEGRVFSAGADLDAVANGLGQDPVWERASSAIADFPGLTIAALNGTLAGGAFGIALACDIRIAPPSANFFYPVMRLGHLPQPSDPGRLSALIGPSRARMILMAGARINAEEALTWGLIDRITTPGTLVETALELAEHALGARAGHVAAIKAMTR
ncbi:enoyl-CoA hydratase/isomerase family protein [Xinfangfangia sp. D13-10-4-6]|uniref:enoyl-CoA hydratase/isomerase family protein n=1 Tax=Pseudogemmobacter hezensis TaxID=2737662 RepID=UPI0015536F5C|nr:enoyl-CoA hydratase/isomerase family protein [Pseudogemmobacter hezensis]NPD14228.1 enoyl-CoA hydratase/isomerase family protein [Pseudogemmobacter hezensis]